MHTIGTKSLIKKTFKEILTHKTLEKITVKEISEKCHINRQTFYYHFEDILDLTRYLYEQEAIILFSNLNKDQTWKDGVDLLLDYVEENKSLCFNTVKSLGNDWLYIFFYSKLYELLIQTVERVTKKTNISHKYKEQQAKYYVISIGAYIIAWLMGVVKVPLNDVRGFLKTQIVE